LPDLIESLNDSNNTNDISQISDHIEPSSSSTSSVSTTAILSPTSPIAIDTKRKSNSRAQSSGGATSSPNVTPKSPRKMGFESYFSTLFRPRQDAKSIIPDIDEQTTKDQPKLVTVKRINSIYKQNSSTNSNTSLQDDQVIPLSPTNLDKHGSPSSLQTSITNIFKSPEQRTKRQNVDNGKPMTFRNELKMEIGSIFGTNNHGIVANKPPLNHSDSRKSSVITERRRPKRKPSYRKISCKDLGKGDCEGFLYRYLPKGTLSLVQWRLYWCVLKGGTLYVFKSKDDKNQEVEIKLEGKNVSPAPERRKYGFRIADESSKNREYFYCSTRDEMAKWMNKMGLAAINFNMDDSKIGGFHKGFVDSREGSPASTPIIGLSSSGGDKQQRMGHMGSIGDSENDSDKESVVSGHKSSLSDTEQPRDKNDKRADLSSVARHARSSSSASILSDTNNSSITSPSNRFVGEINKSYHRASSSPVRFPPSSSYDDDQDNAYVNAAPRLSDSDSSSELPYQRMFSNNQNSQNNRSQDMRTNHDQPRMLTSSGGFNTPTTPPAQLSMSHERTPLSSPRSMNNPLFIPGDEDLSTQSINGLEIPINSSSSSSSAPSPQQYSPAVVRTAPFYVSVYTSTPPIPLVKGTVASSSSSSAPPPPPINDDESFFARRSPSPQPPTPILKKLERTNAYKYQQPK
jgi:hypothetical protein